ncbi:MAG TPA: hypothetical protein VFP60_01140 [Pseudolabrys sp.]|nr:hypothetical protein [Pseudolabrys sp.]
MHFVASTASHQNLDRALAIAAHVPTDPTGRPQPGDRFIVEREQLVAGPYACLIGWRTGGDGKNRGAIPTERNLLVGKMAILSRQGPYRAGVQTDLGPRPSATRITIRHAQAKGDVVEPRELREVIPEMFDLLVAAFFFDLGGRKRRQL